MKIKNFYFFCLFFILFIVALLFYFNTLVFLDSTPSFNDVNGNTSTTNSISDIIKSGKEEILIERKNEEIIFDKESEIKFKKWIFFYLHDLKLFFFNLQDFYNKKFRGCFFKTFDYYADYNSFKEKVLLNETITFNVENIIRAYVIDPENLKEEVKAYDIVITKLNIYVILVDLSLISDSDFKELESFYDNYSNIKESGKRSAFKNLDFDSDILFDF